MKCDYFNSVVGVNIIYMTTFTLRKLAFFAWNWGLQKRGCAAGVMDGGLKWELEEPALNSSRVCDIQLLAHILNEGIHLLAAMG